MQPGDLVKFKEDFYQKTYGIGIILGVMHQNVQAMVWAYFNNERIVVRTSEVEKICENR